MNAEPGFVRPSVGRMPRHDLYMGNADEVITFETPDGGRFGQQMGIIACGGGPLFHRNSPVRRRAAPQATPSRRKALPCAINS